MAVLVALAAAVVVAPAALADTWSGSGIAFSGDGTQPLNISFTNGVTERAQFHYDYIDPFPSGSPGSSATGSFEYSTTAGAAGDVTLPWSFAGFHAFFQVSVTLTAFVDGSGGETLYPLVNAGPTNCCNEPSNWFSYAGTVTLPAVQAGDTYGFRITGSNGDSNATLQGDLAVAWVVDTAADTTTTGNCDLAVADDCSLRDAIAKANASAGFDGINFDIPGPGVHTITPASPLPTITGQTNLDATTQPGFFGLPLVELNGTSAGNVPGLDITGDDVGIHGLAINRFTGSGIVVNASADRATIESNFVGTDASGLLDFGNGGFGVYIAGGSNSRVGGAGVGQGNVISGNDSGGVSFAGFGFHTVLGNLIGTDRGGTSSISNTGPGVYTSGGVSVQIGGSDPGQGNVISAATGAVANADGIQLFSNTNQVWGNKIGTDVTGTADLGNGTRGILVAGIANQIGGTWFGAGNLISGNGSVGVEISGSYNEVEGNLVGVQAGGGAALPNAYGVQLLFGDHNRVGERRSAPGTSSPATSPTASTSTAAPTSTSSRATTSASGPTVLPVSRTGRACACARPGPTTSSGGRSREPATSSPATTAPAWRSAASPARARTTTTTPLPATRSGLPPTA